MSDLIARIEKALDGVPYPAPWKVVDDPGEDCGNCGAPSGSRGPLVCRSDNGTVGVALVIEDDAEDELARFIAAARTLLPEAARQLKIARTALETLLSGMRDPNARGMGASLPVEYELPTSSLKRVRRVITEAIAELDAPAAEET